MLYENAVKSEPANEELHSHLFMSYVRVGDYRSQQRAAMALYKFAPKNPYYFWAVMSIVLQVCVKLLYISKIPRIESVPVFFKNELIILTPFSESL